MKPDNSKTWLQPGWQVLGELVLHAGSRLDDWLTETVSPLDLPPDFLSKVLRSARDARTREVGVEAGRLRLLVLVPAMRPPERCTWGFFRLEKVNGMTSQASPAATIEYYLYPDP